MPPFNVGIAQIDYTPPTGIPLMGNLRNDYAAKGTHDPLYANALVIQNHTNQKIALLSVNICMILRDQVALMRQYIAEHTDIKPQNILIAATHTHAGPATAPLYTSPKADDKQIKTFLTKAAHAVVLANQNLLPTTFKIGRTEEHRLSFNRRLKCKDGQTHMNWEKLNPDFVIAPQGPIDPEIITLAIHQNNQTTATAVNFALHPAILDYTNQLFAADYPAFLAEGLAKIIDDKLITFFFNGTCGNINHIDYADTTAPRRGYDMAQRVGFILAADAQYALRNAQPLIGDQLDITSELVAIDRIEISEQKYQWSLKAQQKLGPHPQVDFADGLPEEHSAPTWIDMYQKFKQSPQDHVEVMTIRIGDLAIVALPGETFCELGLKIKKQSPAKYTIVIELANDAIGYLPDNNAADQQGYETTPGSTRYQIGAGEKIAQAALKQLNQLFKT